MAANKANPNLSQAQFLSLAARVNEATGYQAVAAVYEKRKPKETAAVLAARKLVKDYEAKCAAVGAAVRAEMNQAKNAAMDAVLFQSLEKAVAAVKVLEARRA